MKKIICQSENVAQYIKSIILKYAPYVDSRLELYDMGSCQPIITTQITITDDESYIMFGQGTSGCWSSTDDRATIKKRIDFEEIKSVIDFLLEDYRFINNIMFYKDTGYGSRVELVFSINWTNESIKQGINCGNITLELTFANERLRKQYTSMLLQQYREELKRTITVEKMKDKYIESIKAEYVDKASKKELLELLYKLDEQELKELLCNLDNDVFVKYSITDTEEQNMGNKKCKSIKLNNSSEQ